MARLMKELRRLRPAVVRSHGPCLMFPNPNPTSSVCHFSFRRLFPSLHSLSSFFCTFPAHPLYFLNLYLVPCVLVQRSDTSHSWKPIHLFRG